MDWAAGLGGKSVHSIDDGASYESIIVPTVDLLRNAFVMERLVMHRKHVKRNDEGDSCNEGFTTLQLARPQNKTTPASPFLTVSSALKYLQCKRYLISLFQDLFGPGIFTGVQPTPTPRGTLWERLHFLGYDGCIC